MANAVLVLDTSLLIVWLRLPEKKSAGKNDFWNFDRVDALIRENEQNGATLVLPLATMIETGNLICQCPKDDRKQFADKLADIIIKSEEGTSPWAIFSDQSVLWKSEQLIELAKTWPELTNRNRCHSMGDATIIAVAAYYKKMGFDVKIATGDVGLQQVYDELLRRVSAG